MNVCETTIVQDAWLRNQELTVHGWIYGLKDGLARDLGMSIQNLDELKERYAIMIDSYNSRFE